MGDEDQAAAFNLRLAGGQPILQALDARTGGLEELQDGFQEIRLVPRVNAFRARMHDPIRSAGRQDFIARSRKGGEQPPSGPAVAAGKAGVHAAVVGRQDAIVAGMGRLEEGQAVEMDREIRQPARPDESQELRKGFVEIDQVEKCGRDEQVMI